MEYPNSNTQSRKNKHLNLEECVMIEVRLKDGFSPYKVVKELKRPITTVLNEIYRGTTLKIHRGHQMLVLVIHVKLNYLNVL